MFYNDFASAPTRAIGPCLATSSLTVCPQLRVNLMGGHVIVSEEVRHQS